MEESSPTHLESLPTFIVMYSVHSHLRYREICIWNTRGVLSHLPPNSHAENLRQIFILRPVTFLIQSKWMQQQTNLSNPTSKQARSLSLWLRDSNTVKERRGRQYWTERPTALSLKTSTLAPIMSTRTGTGGHIFNFTWNTTFKRKSKAWYY